MTQLDFLETVLRNEVENTNQIHLFFHRETSEWYAYCRSADNLQQLVPETKDTLTDELFSEAEVILARVSLNVELTERYALPRYCDLIGDDYALLNMKEKTEEETE